MEQAVVEESSEAVLQALAASASTTSIWLHLLLADRCNHSCVHCYQVQGLKGELTREQVEALLREFRAGGGFVVSFSGGEATLREDLVPLLRYAHELGLATVLYTNGFSLTAELASALAACHVWRVDVSIYSHRADEHDAVTRVPGSWAKLTQGVRFLRQERVNVNLKFTPTAPSTASAQQVAQLARQLDAHLMVSESVSGGEAGRSEPTRARRTPDAAIADLAAAPERPTNPLEGKPCGAGNLLTVRSDGQVHPCAQLTVPTGHIGDDAKGLRHAVESEVAQFFRQVTWADFPACRECDLRPHCARCFASAASEVGDMLAPYPAACELAIARYRKATGNAGLVVRPPGDARDPNLGPYHIESDGTLLLAKEQHTAYDQALVDRFPWLRPSREAMQSAACGITPAHQARGLIQLRRPKEDWVRK